MSCKGVLSEQRVNMRHWEGLWGSGYHHDQTSNRMIGRIVNEIRCDHDHQHTRTCDLEHSLSLIWPHSHVLRAVILSRSCELLGVMIWWSGAVLEHLRAHTQHAAGLRTTDRWTRTCTSQLRSAPLVRLCQTLSLNWKPTARNKFFTWTWTGCVLIDVTAVSVRYLRLGRYNLYFISTLLKEVLNSINLCMSRRVWKSWIGVLQHDIAWCYVDIGMLSYIEGFECLRGRTNVFIKIQNAS